MADIFISYARAQQDAATSLADDLKKAGLTVWFDQRLLPGTPFRDEIDRQLKEAKKVIVIWSLDSIDSKWVQAEAAQALDDNKLINVRLPDLPPSGIPFLFREAQSVVIQDRARIIDACKARSVPPPVAIRSRTPPAQSWLLSAVGRVHAIIPPMPDPCRTLIFCGVLDLSHTPISRLIPRVTSLLITPDMLLFGNGCIAVSSLTWIDVEDRTGTLVVVSDGKRVPLASVGQPDVNRPYVTHGIHAVKRQVQRAKEGALEHNFLYNFGLHSGGQHDGFGYPIGRSGHSISGNRPEPLVEMEAELGSYAAEYAIYLIETYGGQSFYFDKRRTPGDVRGPIEVGPRFVRDKLLLAARFFMLRKRSSGPGASGIDAEMVAEAIAMYARSVNIDGWRRAQAERALAPRDEAFIRVFDSMHQAMLRVAEECSIEERSAIHRRLPKSTTHWQSGESALDQ